MKELKLLVSVALALLMVSCSFTILGYAAPAENTWTELASMPTSNQSFNVAVVTNKIYVIASNGNLTIQMYDPATDAWTNKTSAPQDMYQFCVAACDNKIYCLVGTGNAVYDTLTDTWTTKTPSTIHRGSASAIAVDGKIYLIGGEAGDSVGRGPTNSVEMYDPNSDSWVPKAGLPVYDLDNVVTVAFEDKIYLFGKYPSGVPCNVQIYDTKTNTWQTGPATPQAVTCGGATTGTNAPKKIYLFGATGTSIFDPLTQEWSTGASAPGSVSVAGVVDDVFYVVGAPKTYKYLPFGPTLTALSPQNSQNYTSSSIPLNYTVDMQVLLGYSLDGQVNVTLLGNTTLTGLTNGTHSLIFYANYGQENTYVLSTVNFTVALPEPTDNIQQQPLQTQQAATIAGIATAATTIIVAASLLLYRKKHQNKTAHSA